MIQIVASDEHQQYLEELRKHFIAEWGEIDPLVSSIAPAPILALDDEMLIGGLSFTDFPSPGNNEPGIWLNVLLVLPEYRSKGVGTDLVKFAAQEAKLFQLSQIFVYTDIPDFYKRLNWQIVDNSGDKTVLKLDLINC